MPAPSIGWKAVTARLAYLAIILIATLSGLRAGDGGSAEIAERLSRALSPSPTPKDVVDGLRNLALFAGWGAVWQLTAPGGQARRAVRNATLSGAVLSLLVEAAQLLSPVRTTSVLDVLTNSGGALGGALLMASLVGGLREVRTARSFVGVPAVLFAGAYLGAVSLEALVPLFRNQPLPAWGGPLQRLDVALYWLRRDPSLNIPWIDLLLFAPAGAFWLAMRVERGTGYRAALAQTVLGGCALAALVEVARGATGQPIEPGAALTHAVGIALGAWAAHRWLPRLSVRLRGRARPRALLALYALVLAAWSWRPFIPRLSPGELRGELVAARFIPLHSLAQRVDLFSVADVGVQFLLFLPLGGLLAAWPLRSRGGWRHLLPGLYLAAVLELGQVLVAGRFFDLTDLLVQAAGLGVGWTVARRAGYRPHGEAMPAEAPGPRRGYGPGTIR